MVPRSGIHCLILANRLFQLKILKCLSNPGTGQNVLAQYVSFLLDSYVFRYNFIAFSCILYTLPWVSIMMQKETKTICLMILWLKDLYMFISCVLLYLVHVFIVELLHESGIISHLQAMYFPNLIYDFCGERFQASSSSLNLNDVWPLFALLFGGLLLAMTALGGVSKTLTSS